MYENIKFYCEKEGITVYRLCKEAGVSHSLITDLKSGRIKDFKMGTGAKIAKALDITLDDLYYGPDHNKR